MNFYTITGGPGSGKTALINELKKRGYQCIDEVARQIIQEQESIGGNGVPWKDLKLYKTLMLSRFMETYNRALSAPNEIVFFDRDILDLISYDIVTKTESSEELINAAQRLVYNKKVFVAPPWKEIYTIDLERKQTFEEAIEVYQNIVQVYFQFGREVILLPKTNVKDRAEFVINSITRNKRKTFLKIFMNEIKFNIRPLQISDIPKIVSHYTFPWSTPEKTKALWDDYFKEQQTGIRTVAVIKKNNEILGYGSFLRKSQCSFFLKSNIPEINAIWIHEDHRRKGLGTVLIEWMEKLAIQEGYSQIGIGVGLYRDYGPAQKLYIQLGYAPDGNGITYKGQPTIPGETYPLDDDLILWLVKMLK